MYSIEEITKIIIESFDTENPSEFNRAFMKEPKVLYQPIEYAMANELNACEFNVLKYLSRHRKKGGKEDLEKAKHMLDLLIALEYDVVDASDV